MSEPLLGSIPRYKAPMKESTLMFFSAAGCTICYTAVLSNLVYYSRTMGVGSYLILNITVFSPMLLTTVIQTLFDDEVDRRLGSLVAYSYRGTMGFCISFICTVFLPFVTNLSTLSIISLLLGLVSYGRYPDFLD